MTDKTSDHVWIVGVEREAGKPPLWYAVGAESQEHAIFAIVKLIGPDATIATNAPAPEGIIAQPGEIVPL
jgi:hypothetical protein